MTSQLMGNQGIEVYNWWFFSTLPSVFFNLGQTADGRTQKITPSTIVANDLKSFVVIIVDQIFSCKLNRNLISVTDVPFGIVFPSYYAFTTSNQSATFLNKGQVNGLSSSAVLMAPLQSSMNTSSHLLHADFLKSFCFVADFMKATKRPLDVSKKSSSSDWTAEIPTKIPRVDIVS